MQSSLQTSLLAGTPSRLTRQQRLCTTSAAFAAGQRLYHSARHLGTAREGRGLTLATRATAATNFGDERLYSSSSSLLGPPPPVAGGQRADVRGAAPALNIEDVQLESEVHSMLFTPCPGPMFEIHDVIARSTAGRAQE
jgi:hypothetical protein